MNRLLSAFSPRGYCSRCSYWGRMLYVTLGFAALLNCFLLCLFAQRWGGGESFAAGQAFLIVALVLCAVFSLPAGVLILLLYSSFLGYADPPHFPEPGVLASLMLGGGMLGAVLGMCALIAYAFALASRRLRSAGISPYMLALGLLPGGFILLTGLLTFPSKGAIPAATAPEPRACCPLLVPFCWQGCLSRRAFILRSLPVAFAFVPAFVMALLFLEDIGHAYRSYVFILFFLGIFFLSVPALTSHPLAVLGLLAFIVCAQVEDVDLPSLASGLGVCDAALAALILLTLLVSSLRFCALAARRLRDAGKPAHNLTALFIPFLLVGIFGNFVMMEEFALLWVPLFSLWFILQTRLLLRRSRLNTL